MYFEKKQQQPILLSYVMGKRKLNRNSTSLVRFNFYKCNLFSDPKNGEIFNRFFSGKNPV
jgi:hypothetical protein